MKNSQPKRDTKGNPLPATDDQKKKSKREHATLDGEPKFTREYIEMRIAEQRELKPKEVKELSTDLKLYYNELRAKINGLK